MPKPAPAALLREPVPGDKVQAPEPQPPKREARRVLQDKVMQHSDGGAHRPGPDILPSNDSTSHVMIIYLQLKLKISMYTC